MIDETSREASSTISRAAIKLTAAAVFFTLPITGYLSQHTAHAATSEESVQEPSPQSEHQAAQSEHAAHQVPSKRPEQTSPGPTMTLAQVEQIAMQNNPTLGQAEGAIRA